MTELNPPIEICSVIVELSLTESLYRSQQHVAKLSSSRRGFRVTLGVLLRIAGIEDVVYHQSIGNVA